MRRQLFIGTVLMPFVPGIAWVGDLRTPTENVSDLIEAMAQNDADRIAALFSDSAEQSYGERPPRSGDAFRAWLQSDIVAVNGRLEGAELTSEGQTVIATGRYRNDNGYESDANFLFVVEDQKIIRWIVR
jgi:ketosteroid isomerase-like protein